MSGKFTYALLEEIKVASKASVKLCGPITNIDSKMIVKRLTGRSVFAKHPPFIYLSPRQFNSDGYLVDAWGTPIVFQLEQGGDTLMVFSYGPDKKPGGGDDISVSINNVE
ncbi:MAG: hypothetical protein RRC34_16085 [Lentisphaeria bacterium]|nr:hypothetical protein [Lentisphaeria bacterium]